MTDYTFLTLYPTNPGSGFPLSAPVAQTPTVMGSVADDSDATYTTLEAEYQIAGNTYYSDILTVDFALPDPSVEPAFLVMQARARDNAAFASDPVHALTIFTHYSAVSSPGSFYDEWDVSNTSTPTPLRPWTELASGIVPSPRWESFYFLGGSVPNLANPEDGRWAPVTPDGQFVDAQHYAALKGAGIRFTVYARSDDNLTPRKAYLDLFELRMLVAVVGAPPVEDVWFASPIRQRQRADGLGLSTASRTSQLRTKHGSLRGGPNGVD